MQIIQKIRDGLMVVLTLIGGLAIVALMAHVVLDVAMRNLLNKPIPATYEIVTHYYMIALAFIPLAWIEQNRGMVQVELLDTFISKIWITRLDRLIALISTLIYFGLAWVTFQTALNNFEVGSFVMAQNVPLATWPAFFLLPLGFILAAMTTAMRIFETVEVQTT